ncbi:MAG: FecR domain-containing protein [Chlamydiae bacterium]|nr:FecR domain-containing protein [Chlamydiota bacterium]MBI3266473.1 FecR domain-containing protein [Chlamydiota bacterium]
MRRKSFYIFLSLLLTGFTNLAKSEALSQTHIQSFEGEVEVMGPKDTSGKPAQMQRVLSASDTITTGDHAYCVVQIDADNLFRIKQNSNVKIEKIWEEVQKPDGSVVQEYRVHLAKGELTAKLNAIPHQSQFDVTSPVAIAGATGTVYNVKVDPETLRTVVSVLNHEVFVESQNEPQKTTVLKTFQQVEVAPWRNAILEVLGWGDPAETLLEPQDKPEEIEIYSLGQGVSKEEAKTQALEKLTRLILHLRMKNSKTLQDWLNQNPDLTPKIYTLINQAEIIRTTPLVSKGENSKIRTLFQVEIRLPLTSLLEIIPEPLQGVRRSIFPLSQEEYFSKFGRPFQKTILEKAWKESPASFLKTLEQMTLSSGKTFKDTLAQNEKIKAAVQKLVRNTSIDEIEYFSDGSLMISLKIPGKEIVQSLTSITGNIYGENYFSAPQALNFENFKNSLEIKSLALENGKPKILHAQSAPFNASGEGGDSENNLSSVENSITPVDQNLYKEQFQPARTQTHPLGTDFITQPKEPSGIVESNGGENQSIEQPSAPTHTQPSPSPNLPDRERERERPNLPVPEQNSRDRQNR